MDRYSCWFHQDFIEKALVFAARSYKEQGLATDDPVVIAGSDSGDAVLPEDRTARDRCEKRLNKSRLFFASPGCLGCNDHSLGTMPAQGEASCPHYPESRE